MPRIVPITPETISEAASILRAGGLVAFPTETVYGLGANALDPDAVKAIYRAKGRPATNPLIVHIGEIHDVEMLAKFTDAAHMLAAQWWPGPLTIVADKKPVVPDIVTAGGPTVALRIPAHPGALQLLRAAGCPIAAPSANKSEEVSPTRAAHVRDSLGDAVDLILDGGPCTVGLESTVVDATGHLPVVLRLGMITEDMIQRQAPLGSPISKPGNPAGPKPGGQLDAPVRTPGAMPRHYAPRTPLVLVDATAPGWAAEPGSVLVTHRTTELPANAGAARRVLQPADPAAYAADLYDMLRRIDTQGHSRIYVDRVPMDDASGRHS